ncbi:MAG: putative F420-dependent oxidoreductase, family, partial [Actinomycetia bacterium]|nr:putative F420-dependent oxidoreductase, family [Actinomycetes bacterium]
AALYMPDHFIDTALAPMPAMAMALAHTTTLRVCALVLDNDYKHPAIVAKETATMDVLRDGRADLGIGAGWMQVDYDALGLPYDRAGVRVDRLEEALAVVKGCWAEGPFSFTGTHYTIANYDAIPKPVQQPRPRILVGGGAPRVLRLAGREADIVGINPNLRAGAVTADAVHTSLAEETAQKIAWVKEGAGDRFDDIELQIRYFLCTITDNAQKLAEAVAPGFGISPEEVQTSGVALIGTVEQMINELQRRRDTWGVSNIVIGDDMLDGFAPVVAKLAGS